MDANIPLAEWLELKDILKNQGESPVAPRLVMDNGKIFADGKTGEEIEGEILFSDAEISPMTGSINLRAVFPNPFETAPHGMHCRLRLAVAAGKGAYVPVRFIRHDASGKPYVIILREAPGVDGWVAEEQPVETGQGANNRILVKSGIQPDMLIVTDGAVVPGQPVAPGQIVEEPACGVN